MVYSLEGHIYNPYGVNILALKGSGSLTKRGGCAATWTTKAKDGASSLKELCAAMAICASYLSDMASVYQQT